MAKRQPTLRIGTSGYQYDHWRRVFYPDNLPVKDWLPFFARHFDTVEINNTFYHLPGADAFASWRRQVPAGFCFALKFSRFGSHLKKLKDADQTIPLFLERAAKIGNTLGPILVQLPPRWHPNPERLDAFLDAAPRQHAWAVEFRDPAWLSEPVLQILEKHRAALCIHDHIKDHPWRTTADWVYLRFHGGPDKGNYPRLLLQEYARKIRRLLDAGTGVYAYFNNDGHGYALANAAELKRLLGIG